MENTSRTEKRSALLATTILMLSIIAVLFSTSRSDDMGKPGEPAPPAVNRPDGICPPFHLLDEDGHVIDPVKGVNTDKPYSPKQTCGKCHDYEKITEAYHFAQGKGEKVTADQSARCQWATTPGNYGGNWCSPAPLYRYLSPKKNDSPKTMDMTSFDFFAAGCGACHPGGGSAEYDRAGKRYDRWMADRASGLSPGGENGFDGDYYKARWSETGVLEADCLLCHFPGYKFSERGNQLKALNFRWAATAGAGLAAVTGSVKKHELVTVAYDKAKFHPDGTLSLNIVREPRNESCLACHAQPGWKKRGLNFRERTDVHVRAGLKCVDCHPAGSSADDPRIRGKELHEIGKGDDPGGLVRNDLDNTGRACVDCHAAGRFGAPIARHRWLPPLHLDTIACETCHVPERLVKPIQFQASDVFNPGARIPSKGKHLWTFYGPDGAFRNHYGYLVMEGFDDKPTEPFKPFLARYKGKIYPVNRIHTAWPGIEVGGKSGLMQPKMGDIYRMWTTHQDDPVKFPELAKITDDNGDGVIEVNRPEEIDALIASVTALLTESKYPMADKRIVWVYNDRVYTSGAHYRTVPKREWEASPYGNVHKYAHDVYPAKSALGSNGCTDCHHPTSDFFFAPTVKYPFDAEAKTVTEPQLHLLGISPFWAAASAWRETYGKPILYGLLFALMCIFIVLAGELVLGSLEAEKFRSKLALIPWLVGLACGMMAIMTAGNPDLADYMLPSRFWLDTNQFAVSVVVFTIGAAVMFWSMGQAKRQGSPPRPVSRNPGNLVVLAGMVLAGICGFLMLLKIPLMEAITRASYTVFDAALVLILMGSLAILSFEAVTCTILTMRGKKG